MNLLKLLKSKQSTQENKPLPIMPITATFLITNFYFIPPGLNETTWESMSEEERIRNSDVCSARLLISGEHNTISYYEHNTGLVSVNTKDVCYKTDMTLKKMDEAISLTGNILFIKK